MNSGVQLAREELRSFAAALVELLDARRISRADLADQVEVSPSTVSNWTLARARPEVGNVEQIEDALSVPRGHLAKHLGYQPVSEKLPPTETLDEFLIREGILSDQQRQILVGTHHYMLSVQAQLRMRARRDRR